jgi:hypothetical protein
LLVVSFFFSFRITKIKPEKTQFGLKEIYKQANKQQKQKKWTPPRPKKKRKKKQPAKLQNKKRYKDIHLVVMLTELFT